MAETLWRCVEHNADGVPRLGKDPAWCWKTSMPHVRSMCRMVEGVWSAPGELVDPAKVDYSAALLALEDVIPGGSDARQVVRAVRRAVDAALGVGEPVEGSGE